MHYLIGAASVVYQKWCTKKWRSEIHTCMSEHIMVHGLNIQRSILLRILIPMVVLALVVSVAIGLLVPKRIHENVIQDSILNAEKTVGQFKALRAYYTNNVVAKVKASGALAISYNHHDRQDTIPLPATMIHDLSAILTEQGTAINLYSAFPFPVRNQRKLDAFQQEAWDALNRNPKQVYSREMTNANGEQVVRVAVADTMVADACVACHNKHPESPKTDWKVGDVRGVLEVALPIDAPLARGVTMATLVVGAIALLSVLIIGSFVVIYQRSVARNIATVLTVSERMAAGDLSSRIQVTSKDEAGRMLESIQIMQEKLRMVIAKVRENAEILSSSAAEIGSTSQMISSLASEQNASVEETSTAIDQMGNSIEQNASNARSTDEIAQQTSQVAAEGGEAVKKTVAAMQEIAKRTSVIDDISFKTRLLALNAAIEAARAGAAGRGFGVVATEVGTLAQRSQTAAVEIAEYARNGVQLAVAAGKYLDKIVPESERTARLVTEISRASSEQSSSVDRIRSTMQCLTQSAQNNAAVSEELAATTEHLVALATELNELMAFFSDEDPAFHETGR